MDKIDIKYGYSFIYPENVIQIVEVKQTKWEKFVSFFVDGIVFMIDPFLFALSVTCFAYAFKQLTSN